MILCVGEILADLIGERDERGFAYRRKAGGAPFNVACAVKQFGGKSAFVGCVGDDGMGRFLTDFAQSRKLDGLCVKADKGKNTTLAFVDLKDDGEREFSFARNGTADYALSAVPQKLFAAADIIHIGSLMLTEGRGRRYAERLVQKARGNNKLVGFDVNYRADLFCGNTEAEKALRQMTAEADIVKFSREEWEMFGGDVKGADKLVCITLGEDGSRWLYGGRTKVVDAIKVKPVDTTGAGDAFYAGVLTCLDGKSKAEWNDDLLDRALRFGNICGALNTLGKGAIDCLPTRTDIQKFL